LISLKTIMNDLYYIINFQFNGGFYKIHIRYINIRNLCTVKDLVKSFTIDLASKTKLY
jgi:hypothetical protein